MWAVILELCALLRPCYSLFFLPWRLQILVCFLSATPPSNKSSLQKCCFYTFVHHSMQWNQTWTHINTQKNRGSYHFGILPDTWVMDGMMLTWRSGYVRGLVTVVSSSLSSSSVVLCVNHENWAWVVLREWESTGVVQNGPEWDLKTECAFTDGCKNVSLHGKRHSLSWEDEELSNQEAGRI